MRLLNTETYEVVEVTGRTPSYAILSHRWENEEITFKTINSEALQDASLSSFKERLRPSAAKVRGACAVARQQEFEWVWIDTCCIDKSSSEELRTALNSMFKWYRQATICYTFLNDVAASNIGPNMFDSDREDRNGRASEWFERGWTLQELLAPQKMEFYDKQWTFMGTRNDLSSVVGKVAGIRPEYLKDSKDGNGRPAFREASVATKMSWMAGRTTRDVEDIAYSLLGIFNINLTPQYGEGIKAFSRLQNAIMSDYGSFDESLFAWKRPQDGELKCFRGFGTAPKFEHNKWGLLAPSPDCFKDSGDIVIVQRKLKQRIAGGFQKTSEGIFLTLPLFEVQNYLRFTHSQISFPLNCWRQNNQTLSTIVLQLSRDSGRTYYRTQCNQIGSRQGAKVGNTRQLGVDQGALGSAPVVILQPRLDID